ncbi:tetratricopeptide repeat protein, partial [Sphingobium yanoikuyae]
MSRTLRLRVTCAALALACMAPMPTLADVPGVAPLIQQGRYWQSKGRQDLANQAYRRALALDPNNAEARKGLAGPPPKAQPAPKPTPAPAPARRAETTPRPTPTPAAAPSAANRTQAARPSGNAGGGASRASGFKALDANDLDGAERAFERAVAANRNDADALGGLGLVRLRQGRFGEARDLLDQASQRGSAGQWAQALASARFFGG